jgi:hypothetical protein
MMSGGYLRCMTAQRHLCDNRASVRREVLEAKVLEVLAERLMEPALAEAFAEEFTAEWNRLAAAAGVQGERLRQDLAAVERKLGNLIDAVADGLRSAGIQAKLAGLEAERDRLVIAIERSKPTPVRLMPQLGEAYRHTLAKLQARLSGPSHDPEAMGIARQLIASVVIHSSPPRKPPGFTVEGHLAKLLTTAQPSLPDHVAEGIASAARLSVKEGPRGHCPLAGRVREGRRPARQRYPSNARRWRMRSGPQDSLRASGESGAITRQKGVGSSSIRSSARSATMRRKIAVEVGQVATAPFSCANSARSATGSCVRPGGMARMRASSSAGEAMNSRSPAPTPAKGFASTVTCGGFASWYFCSQLFGMAVPRQRRGPDRRSARALQGGCA